MYPIYESPQTPQYDPSWGYQQPRYGYEPQGSGRAVANLQLENRDAESILREQIRRQTQSDQGWSNQQTQYNNQDYGYYNSGANHYQHRLHGDDQVRGVMAEAQRIAGIIPKRNGKPFIVIDKRNFQFYLYSKDGRLLRIGPVAIGKGRTRIRNFETPVGVYPIRTKEPVADWIRPDWYFIEENEPIPSRWEDRRVPGFFRFKMVFYGNSYIHYAEATGGRLTHGCIGLDWQDAEAVFHTLSVGSYCIIIDNAFLIRLAKGEFPIYSPKKKKKDKEEEPKDRQETITATVGREDNDQRTASEPRAFTNLW
jgi:lipoprotein-anchoring transpeptidase ErfK/SrfK